MVARDVMETHLCVASPDDRLADVARVLDEHPHSMLPVVDEDGRLVGVLSELDLMKEKGYMTSFFEEIREHDGGLSAYGEGMVRRALEMGAVDTLLISEKYGKDRLDLHCGSCGKELERSVEEGKSEADIDFACPDCSEVMELVGRKDMVQELNELAHNYNSDVVLISTESEEGGILVQAFGGIAAILRYRIT